MKMVLKSWETADLWDIVIPDMATDDFSYSPCSGCMSGLTAASSMTGVASP